MIKGQASALTFAPESIYVAPFKLKRKYLDLCSAFGLAKVSIRYGYENPSPTATKLSPHPRTLSTLCVQ